MGQPVEHICISLHPTELPYFFEYFLPGYHTSKWKNEKFYSNLWKSMEKNYREIRYLLVKIIS